MTSHRPCNIASKVNSSYLSFKNGINIEYSLGLAEVDRSYVTVDYSSLGLRGHAASLG